jgi:excisionase family DNA binding protein
MTKTVVSNEELGSRQAYSIAEAAQLLGVNKITVYRRIYAGRIKVLSGGGQITITKTELDRFLNKVEVYQPKRKLRRKGVQVGLGANAE